jgi:hypothetical protein
MEGLCFLVRHYEGLGPRRVSLVLHVDLFQVEKPGVLLSHCWCMGGLKVQLSPVDILHPLLVFKISKAGLEVWLKQ